MSSTSTCTPGAQKVPCASRNPAPGGESAQLRRCSAPPPIGEAAAQSLIAQCIVVCRAYKLAEALRLSSMLRRHSGEKREAAATRDK